MSGNPNIVSARALCPVCGQYFDMWLQTFTCPHERCAIGTAEEPEQKQEEPPAPRKWKPREFLG